MIKIDEEVSLCAFNHYGSGTHSHNFLELAYIEEGEALHILGENRQTILKKGDYFIVDYDTPHKYTAQNNRPVKIINCLFMPSFIDKSLVNCRKFSEVIGNYLIKINYTMLTQNPSDTVFNDEDGRILNIIKNMLFEYNKKDNGYTEILRANLIEILVLTLRRIMSADADSSKDSAITSEIKEYVRKNFNRNISLTDISKNLNYSIPYLSIKFKKDTGVNFNEYIQKYRIEQSCILLKNTDKKIQEVANSVGYGDLKYFNSVFKKIIGITPYRFRRL